ncbi:Asp-tRNA(Asn)/Glu-tRNA(Gln) amidotransferase subunit GatB [Alphaproteobacteria bacterium endosymbiont of Tiliacea citrago]|uniref:Asp-tRNA(Asn)/Glu-tRNA(Gln) amidotransferase subunit GatB n=1 Tax=Alphaproteobacteria bacterium endosymbiont of Tiliacea citrago TaxID=3077944 RepID=UPI00313C3D0F
MMYKKTLGVEIHAQIDTETKLFSRALFDEHSEPNENVDFLDAGLPGTLPVPNENAIYMAMKTSLALNMQINQISIFDRKHYFYQDLPLGYQITQFYKPIGVNGYLDCSFGRVRINRLHIETDAGKSIYKDGKTFVDLNRAGVPLMEIVTEPDFHNEDQVVEFLKELRAILLCIKTCKCDMEMGNLRADVNISLAKDGDPLGTRAEIKNLNSFSSIRKAVQFEATLQEKTLKAGQKVIQETKLFDPTNNTTKAMRNKEDALDYEYFPDPDLLPVFIDQSKIDDCKNSLPKLPIAIRKELQLLGIAEEQSRTITETMERYEFFAQLIQQLPENLVVKASNWVCSELIGKLAKTDIELEDFLNRRKNFFDILYKVILKCESNEITRVVAKEILDKSILDEKDLDFNSLVEKNNLLQKDTIDINFLIENLINNSPDEVSRFKKGKTSLLMWFVGQIMKETKGQVDPEVIKTSVLNLLNK